MGNLHFDESALQISPSPPPSQGSNSASSAIESKFLRRVRTLKYTRLALCTISVALTSTVIACEGHSLHVYNSTHLNSEWWLPLWPHHFDLRPSVAFLVSAAIVLFASLVYIIVSVIPSPRSQTTLHNLLFTLYTFLSTITFLFTLAYTTHLHHADAAASRDTLGSWTCRWSLDASSEAPRDFAGICRRAKAAWGIVVALVVYHGFVASLAVVWGWYVWFLVWRERRRERKLGGGGDDDGWAMQAAPAEVYQG